MSHEVNLKKTTYSRTPMSGNKGLYKRGNIWWVRYVDSEGNMHYESSKSRSKKTAEGLLITRKKEAQDGVVPVKVSKLGNQPFSEVAEQYSIWAERQRSYARSKKYFIQALVDEFGKLPIRKLNTLLVEKYQTKLLNAGKKPGTVNRHLATVKHMVTKAVEWEMADEALLKRVQKVKLLPENNQRLRYLDEGECEALVAACPSHLKPIVITALNTGMRREEILSLEWDKNIDLKNKLVLLHRTKSGKRREIPINLTLFKALEDLPRHINSPYVFCTGQGKRYQTITKAFNRAVKRTGIKDFTFHDLRHTFASRLVMAGVDLATVRELLGHQTLAMTLRYAHLAPGHKVKAVGILDNQLPRNQRIRSFFS